MKTHRFIVENTLSELQTIKTDIVFRYVKYYRSQLTLPSSEVQYLANLLWCDVRSCTGKNLNWLNEWMKLFPVTSCKMRMRQAKNKLSSLREEQEEVVKELLMRNELEAHFTGEEDKDKLGDLQ